MKNYRNELLSLVALACVGFAAAAQADPIPLFNTGVDAGGVVLADGTIGDPHYALVSIPGGTTTIRVRSSVGGFPIPPWNADNALSRWIGPNNAVDLDGPVGTYVYLTTFDLTGLDPATAVIAGLWATDNNGLDIVINGTPLGFITPFASFAFFPFAIPDSALFAGVNTLRFIVNNLGGPTGLRVQFTSATADPIDVAEPATLALFGVALAGLGMVRRRARSHRG